MQALPMLPATATPQIGDWVVGRQSIRLGGSVTTASSRRAPHIHAGQFDHFADRRTDQPRQLATDLQSQQPGHRHNTAIYSPNGGSVGIGLLCRRMSPRRWWRNQSMAKSSAAGSAQIQEVTLATPPAWPEERPRRPGRVVVTRTAPAPAAEVGDVSSNGGEVPRCAICRALVLRPAPRALTVGAAARK